MQGLWVNCGKKKNCGEAIFQLTSVFSKLEVFENPGRLCRESAIYLTHRNNTVERDLSTNIMFPWERKVEILDLEV